MSLVTFPKASEVPESARIDGAPWSMRYLVDGEVRSWNGPGAAVLSPVCYDKGGRLERAVIGHLPELDPATAMTALEAARRAWSNGRGVWPTMRVRERIACVERFAQGMALVREDVVRLLMWEIGKSRKDSETEFDRTLAYIHDTTKALADLDKTADTLVESDGFVAQIRRSPLGVVLCMGPFNYPLNETYAVLIPALIMGNTVVSKLPKYGGLCHVPMFAAMQKAFPPGVVNVIQGDGATIIGPIMNTGDIDALAFIGSTSVANQLKKLHPRPNRLRCILGLGAKNPAVIMPDADLALSVKECVSGALSFNGQRCTAIKIIIFAHESIADRFAAEVADAVSKLRHGMPWEPGVNITPLPEEAKPKKLADLVSDATDKGARVLTGGETLASFFSPAVVYPVRSDMRLFDKEQFGPVVPIVRYKEDTEIDSFMRQSPYGQQIALFGNDPRRIGALVDALVNQLSRVNLNSQCRRGPDTFPFTGRKDSAEATLSVSDALRAFSIRALVAASGPSRALVDAIRAGDHSAFLSDD